MCDRYHVFYTVTTGYPQSCEHNYTRSFIHEPPAARTWANRARRLEFARAMVQARAMTWMVYGASGHTGKLVAELAAARGERPVLAGRSAERIAPIAAQLGLDIRAFALDDPHEIRAALGGIDTVAHCAGPFSATSRPMVDACLATGTNYVDITGEIEVFEAIYARDAEAAATGVVLLPGAGFDVVPTDCVAACLAERLPDATHLDLAFAARVKLARAPSRP